MKSFSLEQLSELTQSNLQGDPKKIISGVADLEEATANDASFIGNTRYQRLLEHTQAGVIFVPPHLSLIPNKNYLIHSNPSEAFQILLRAVFSDRANNSTAFSGIHPTAVIHPTATLGEGCSVGPHAVIDQHVVIGPHTCLGANCFIGAFVTIGSHCALYSNITIREYCHLGNHVILQPGAVIGSDGFGYITDKNGVHQKLEQYGNVIIEDDVEIGANTTIDRARFKSTTIKKGTKIDNLVQIAHNNTIGPYNLIAALTGLAGSSETGSHVFMGGQVGVNAHVTIGPKSLIAARTAVTKSLPSGTFSGAPAVPQQQYNRMLVSMKHLESYVKQLEELTSQVKEMQQQLDKKD